MSGHEQWEELAVGHALGALEPEDDQTFADHLRECDQCRRVLADMEAVTAQLAYGVDAVEPPPALLESIMSEVRTSDRVSVIRDRPPVVTPMRRSRRAPRLSGSWLATAAALVLVVALAGWNFQLRADNAAKSRELAARNGYLRAATDPAAQAVALKDSTGGPARAQVLVQGTRAWLVVDGFTPNDTAKQTYVLWKLSGDAKTPVRTFDVKAEGPNFIDAGEVRAGSGDTFAVSIEDGRTMPDQPGKVVVAA
jgi:hypothetical protein